jgi:hypothetical protein
LHKCFFLRVDPPLPLLPLFIILPLVCYPSLLLPLNLSLLFILPTVLSMLRLVQGRREGRSIVEAAVVPSFIGFELFRGFVKFCDLGS